MSSEIPIDELVDILEGVRDVGGVDCSGSCHIRRPGEVHCRSIAEKLGLSPSRVKERIQDLLRMGLLLRSRSDAGRGRIVTRFIISPLGDRTLAIYRQRLQEEGIV